MNFSSEREEIIDERKVRESSVNRRRVRIEEERSKSESKFTAEESTYDGEPKTINNSLSIPHVTRYIV